MTHATTTMKDLCGHCSRRCRVIDRSGHSRTVRCWRCRRCTLIIEHPAFSTRIALRDFHLARGKGHSQVPLRVQLEANNLWDCLEHGCSLPELSSDFGIATFQHRQALEAAVKAGVTAYDFDRVWHDGPALTLLARSIPFPPHPELEFVPLLDGEKWWGCPFCEN